MLVIELATQNVKGFSPSARAALRPGYNVMVPAPGAQPGLLSIFAALLYNDGSGTDAMLASGAQARAGLTAQGTDGRVYRLVRALGGGGALHRLEPNNQWTVLAQENAEIGRQLRAALGVPSRDAFEQLFTFSPGCLPSRRKSGGEKDVKDLSPGGAAPGRLQAAGDSKRSIRPTSLVEHAMAASARSAGESHRMADTLKAEVAAGKVLEELQYKLEGMQRRLFELDALVHKVDGLVKKADELKGELAKMHSLEALGLTPDALQSAARYDDAKKKLQDQLGKLAQEDAFTRDNGGPASVAPLVKDQQFLAGAGAGVVSLGAGIALRSSGLGALSLLSIAGFGYAGLCALRWIGRLQQVDALGRRQTVTRDREQKLYAAFDGEYLLIKGAMKVVELEDGKEFLAYLTRQQQMAEQLAAIERELAASQGSTEINASFEEHARVGKDARELEAKIAEAGAGVTRDWHEAERELQETEAEVGEATGGGPMVAVGGSFESTGPVAPLKDDPTPRLLAAAQELFAGASLESLGAALRDRTGQYITALTDRRYSAVLIDGKGNAELVAPGRQVPAGQLADLDLDLLYIAVKLTIVERYAPLGKPVLILDEPFLGFDDAKLALLSRMLKHIGTQTQVLHATALPAHQGLADVTHSC